MKIIRRSHIAHRLSGREYAPALVLLRDCADQRLGFRGDLDDSEALDAAYERLRFLGGPRATSQADRAKAGPSISGIRILRSTTRSSAVRRSLNECFRCSMS